jgi:hypothetical protein
MAIHDVHCYLSLLQTFPAFHFRNLLADEEEKEALPPAMQLSIAELQCASGHALGIYGDLDVFVGKAVSCMA